MKRITIKVNSEEVDIIVPPNDVSRIEERIENKKGVLFTNMYCINFEKDKVSIINVEDYTF
jgi:hypothetical protein